jgi:hypothetical protein
MIYPFKGILFGNIIKRVIYHEKAWEILNTILLSESNQSKKNIDKNVSIHLISELPISVFCYTFLAVAFPFFLMNPTI